MTKTWTKKLKFINLINTPSNIYLQITLMMIITCLLCVLYSLCMYTLWFGQRGYVSATLGENKGRMLLWEYTSTCNTDTAPTPPHTYAHCRFNRHLKLTGQVSQEVELELYGQNIEVAEGTLRDGLHLLLLLFLHDQSARPSRLLARREVRL